MMVRREIICSRIACLPMDGTLVEAICDWLAESFRLAADRERHSRNAPQTAGAAFLLWLAWKIATAGPATGTGEGKAAGFIGAMAFQWMNPKGWLVAVSAAGTFLPSVSETPLAHATTIGVLFFSAALPCGLLWLAVGAALRAALKNERTARAFNLLMGLALAGSVLLLFR
jgi:threonine/homoserine/homoserine lactone efflux protein